MVPVPQHWVLCLISPQQISTDFTDSQNAVSVISKGSAKLQLNQLVEKLYFLPESHTLGRRFRLILYSHSFNLITRRLGMPNFERFASHSNHMFDAQILQASMLLLDGTGTLVSTSAIPPIVSSLRWSPYLSISKPRLSFSTPFGRRAPGGHFFPAMVLPFTLLFATAWCFRNCQISLSPALALSTGKKLCCCGSL